MPQRTDSLLPALILGLLVLGATQAPSGGARRRPVPPPVPREGHRDPTPPPAWERRRRSQQDFDSSLRIEARRRGDRVELVATNRTGHDLTLRVEPNFRNLHDPIGGPALLGLTPRQSLTFRTLTLRDPLRPWRFRYTARFAHGRWGARHDNRVVYALPFGPGTRRRVVQGYGGGRTHHGKDRYAVDFAMRQGTPVHAARAGIVAATRADSDVSGPTEDFLEFANYIIIEHADGTVADYGHLRKGGVRVEVDQRVTAGDLIGYSGNTGYSHGPHLHFAVGRVVEPNTVQTLPVRFVTGAGIVSRLETGRSYEAVALPDDL